MRAVHYAWIAVAIATVFGQCAARADVAIPDPCIIEPTPKPKAKPKARARTAPATKIMGPVAAAPKPAVKPKPRPKPKAAAPDCVKPGEPPRIGSLTGPVDMPRASEASPKLSLLEPEPPLTGIYLGVPGETAPSAAAPPVYGNVPSFGGFAGGPWPVAPGPFRPPTPVPPVPPTPQPPVPPVPPTPPPPVPPTPPPPVPPTPQPPVPPTPHPPEPPPHEVPLPSTLALLAIGALAMRWRGR